MATPGELIKIVAETCHLPEVTVATYYKFLREAGLTTKGGRGPSAAKMQPSDVANLFIALAASSQAKNGPSTVIRFRAYPRRQQYVQYNLPIAGDTFGEFADNLFQSACDGSLDSILRGVPDDAFQKTIWKVSAYEPGEDPKATGYLLDFSREEEIVNFQMNRDGKEIVGANFWPDDQGKRDFPLSVSVTLYEFGIEEVCRVLRGEAVA